jgi:hypothetical protein
MVSRRGDTWEVSLAPEAEVRAAIPAVVSRVPAARVELRRPTLEDVFVQLVTAEGSTLAARDLARERNGEVAS